MDTNGILRTGSACVCAITLLAVLVPASAELPQHVRLQTLGPLAEESEQEDGPRDTQFGFDVAIRDGLAFAGMPVSELTGRTGRVGVFTQGTSGWVRTATITASDKTSGDFFGRAVSYRDGLLVVGSNRAAYVYKRINGVWRELQKIVPPAADGVRLFSTDLKHEAGVLAIGAFGNETTRDSVYVFEQDATGKFVRRARISASGGHLGDGFGTSISMTNAIIVVGGGGAYILGRNSSGNWVQRQKLVSRGTDPGLGPIVAVDRGMILVSAGGEVPPGEDEFCMWGAVVGFLPGTTQYVESFRLHPDTALSDSHGCYQNFGMTIAMFDKRIAIGGFLGGICDCIPWSIVATYSRNGSSVIPLGYIIDGSTVGASVAIANNLLLVGSPRDDGSDVTGSSFGFARLYHLNRFEP